MDLRRCYRNKDGKRHAYWALVESYRTARGSRQRVVAWLGGMDEQGRLGVKHCADRAAAHQGQPSEHQRILLQRLGLKLPSALERAAMSWKPDHAPTENKDFILQAAEVGLGLRLYHQRAVVEAPTGFSGAPPRGWPACSTRRYRL